MAGLAGGDGREARCDLHLLFIFIGLRMKKPCGRDEITYANIDFQRTFPLRLPFPAQSNFVDTPLDRSQA